MVGSPSTNSGMDTAGSFSPVKTSLSVWKGHVVEVWERNGVGTGGEVLKGVEEKNFRKYTKKPRR